jgi:Amt family ammonium transporter
VNHYLYPRLKRSITLFVFYILIAACFSTVQAEEKIMEIIENNSESNLRVAGDVNKNDADIASIRLKLENAAKNRRANTADISVQKSLIENNSIRLYEILLKISNNAEKLEGVSETLESVKVSKESSSHSIAKENINTTKRLWILLVIILVSIIPLAFASSTIHTYFMQNHDRQIPAANNAVLVWFATFLGFFLVGFSLMYGNTQSGWVGSISFYPWTHSQAAGNITPDIPSIEFFLYQIGFATLFSLLVYFILGKRLSEFSCIILSFFIGLFIFPVLGHWVWAGHFIPGNQGWLETKGFIDHAGAGIVHSAAAWFALIVVWKLDTIVKAQTHKKSDKTQATEASVIYPIYPGISIFLLWLGLIGLNIGILPVSSEQITITILNITLAGGSAGITLFFYHAFFNNKSNTIPIAFNGFVCGLVAISAASTMVTPLEALLIGVIAGLIQPLAFNLLRKIILTKPEQLRAASLIAVHGFAGIWGSLSVALLGVKGEFTKPDFIQLTTQGFGIVAIFGYSVVLAWIIMFIWGFYRKYHRMSATLSNQTTKA